MLMLLRRDNLVEFHIKLFIIIIIIIVIIIIIIIIIIIMKDMYSAM